MTRIFLDANVLVSVLNSEYPLFRYSSRVLSLASHRKFEVYTSPLCLAIAFYFAEKKKNAEIAKQKIETLCQHLKISENTKSGVGKTLKNQQISDFEDGLEYYAAIENKCNFIITEDVTDFHFSTIPVLSCQDFFEQEILKS